MVFINLLCCFDLEYVGVPCTSNLSIINGLNLTTVYLKTLC